MRPGDWHPLTSMTSIASITSITFIDIRHTPVPFKTRTAAFHPSASATSYAVVAVAMIGYDLTRRGEQPEPFSEIAGG